MRVMLLLFLSLFAAEAATAQVYRCRDEAGNLVMTDDAAKFPPGCKPLEKDDDREGSLNVVPAPEVPAPPGRSVEQAVREQQAETSRRKERIASFRAEAREIAGDYQQALVKRNEAYNSWSYGSRKAVKDATETMEEAKKRKRELLAEVYDAYLPGRVREEVRKILDPVP
jgi:hypothetical protein